MTTEQRSGVKALLRDYRHYAGATLWLALALMILGALAEGIGILMLVPLAAVAVDVESSDFLDSVPGLASGLSVDQRFWLALLVFVGAMALRSALTYARDLRLARLLAGYEASLRLRAAATLARRGWSFASGIGQAGMQSLLLTDVPRSGLAVSQAQQFAVAAVLIVVQLALAAAFLSLRFAALALAILAVASLLSIGFMRRGVRSGMALVRRSEESTGSGFRLHAGLKAAQAQGTVAQFLAEYRVSLTGACEESVRFSRDLSLSRSLAFLASAVAAGLLVLVGYRVLGLGFPVLVASLVLFARTAAPVQQLQQAAHNVTAYAPSFAAIERRLGKLEPGAVQAVPMSGSSGASWRYATSPCCTARVSESATCRLSLLPANGSASAVRPAGARPRFSTSSPDCLSRRRAQSRWTGSRSAASGWSNGACRWLTSGRKARCSTTAFAAISAPTAGSRPTTSCGRLWRSWGWTSACAASRAGSTSGLETAAAPCPGVNGSGWRSPARCCASRRC